MATALSSAAASTSAQRSRTSPVQRAVRPCTAPQSTWASSRSGNSSGHWRRRAAATSAAAAGGAAAELATSTSVAAVGEEREVRPGIWEGYWTWEGHRIRYHRSGSSDPSAPAVLCVHGFGASACHWRKNLPVLGESCRAYAIDLLGYGYSDKPDPRPHPINSIYNFPNWGRQLRSFTKEVIGGPVTLTCNSVGGLAGLQAALDEPELFKGVQVINISLRMLHINKQEAWQRPLVKALQDGLRTSALGPWFFGQIATPRGVKNVLQQCYGDSTAVTDELVDLILTPGLQPGAVDVFLDFISYSLGPLPEEQLQAVTVPVSVVWGEEDPWEKIEWGREFAKYPSVQEFVSLPGVGHCPQDEAPHLVNPLILEFVKRVQ